MMYNLSLLSGLIETLNILVLKREKNTHLFQLFGPISEWYRVFSGKSQTELADVQTYLQSPFLQHFLPDAQEFLDTQTTGHLSSGLWCEQGANGEDYQFEAMAVIREEMKLLIIQRVGAGTHGLQAVLQTARESGLQHHQAMMEQKQVEHVLGGKLEQSERLRDDLVAVLDRLELGTIMTNSVGVVTFVSHAAQRLLKTTEPATVGQKWSDIPAFSGQDKTLIQEMLQRPFEQRTKLPVVIEQGKGRRVSLEIDVQEDPRDSQRMIFFLYDVSEVQDLRGLLTEKSRFFDLVGKSSAMTELYKRIQDIAPVEATVLVEGETGTGKELVARAIHQSEQSKRWSICRG